MSATHRILSRRADWMGCTDPTLASFAARTHLENDIPIPLTPLLGKIPAAHRRTAIRFVATAHARSVVCAGRTTWCPRRTLPGGAAEPQNSAQSRGKCHRKSVRKVTRIGVSCAGFVMDFAIRAWMRELAASRARLAHRLWLSCSCIGRTKRSVSDSGLEVARGLPSAVTDGFRDKPGMTALVWFARRRVWCFARDRRGISSPSSTPCGLLTLSAV